MDDCEKIRISDYDVIGFDVDHTLAKNKLPNLFNAVHKSMTKFLVEQKGYDRGLLEPFHVHKDFCTRGLIFDIEKGNFLKLAEDGTILRASHGTRFLLDSEIKAHYGEKRHWGHFEQLINRVDNIGDAGYRIFENFYDMIGVVTCARLVDITDQKSEAPRYSFWPDIVEAYNHTYNPSSYADNIGEFFPAFKKRTADFLQPCSESVKQWLKRLKHDQNKVLFIMTSSRVDFAKANLEFILGPEYESLFDIFITHAKKPGFFYANNPFLKLDGVEETDPPEVLESGQFYSRGNYQDLTKFFAKVTGKDDPKVLYVGDSLRSDIFPSKNYVNWDTLLIVEEMEAEMSPKGSAGNRVPKGSAGTKVENGSSRDDEVEASAVKKKKVPTATLR